MFAGGVTLVHGKLFTGRHWLLNNVWASDCGFPAFNAGFRGLLPEGYW